MRFPWYVPLNSETTLVELFATNTESDPDAKPSPGFCEG